MLSLAMPTPMPTPLSTLPPPPAGTQTLMRGLQLIECVADGVADVRGIAQRLGTPRSTTHRLLGSLVQAGWLHHIPYRGYLLGPKLLWLGQHALEQRPLAALARPHLLRLAEQTGDTVHLGTLEAGEVLYLDKVAGTQGLEMRSRVGQRMPLASTGIGKALMLGIEEDGWKPLWQQARAGREPARDARGPRAAPPPLRPWRQWLAEMRGYREAGVVFDLEENERGIRCVGAPVRDIGGQVVAAVSVASALPYMPDERLQRMAPVVRQCADRLSKDLGWTAN